MLNFKENDFYHLNEEFNTNVLGLLKIKGFCPYEYWDSFEKIKEGLHSKDNFYNTLTNCEINDKNFEHIFNIQDAFKMNILRDYHDLYSKVYVLLLACIFETFRKESINSFELDPAHYLSTLGFIWDTMLR